MSNSAQVKHIYVGTQVPRISGNIPLLWVDTAVEPPVMKVSVGKVWKAVSQSEPPAVVQTASTSEKTAMGDKIDPLTKWPKEALTHLLDTLHISYPHNPTRDQLVALVPDTHHSQIAEDVPSDTWTVDKIKQWLDARQVSYTGVTGKDNLLYVVHQTIALEAVGVHPNEVADALPPLDESL